MIGKMVMTKLDWENLNHIFKTSTLEFQLKSFTMKHFLLIILVPFLTILNSCNNIQKQDSESVQYTKIKKPMKLLRHVVLFNFKDTTSDETVREIEQSFARLQDNISEIHSFEWGVNNSPEGLDKGLTHCFLVTFLSEEDRDSYLPHPVHQEFVEFAGPYIEDVTVVDYWVK